MVIGRVTCTRAPIKVECSRRVGRAGNLDKQFGSIAEMQRISRSTTVVNKMQNSQVCQNQMDCFDDTGINTNL